MAKQNLAWTADEDETLVRLKSRKVPVKQMVRYVSGKTAQAIYNRLGHLGMSDRRAWKQEEDTIIRDHYHQATIPSFARLLPERTIGSIYARAWRLGLSNRINRD
jgi:hypothetical protein